jgi:hypothetical protein
MDGWKVGGAGNEFSFLSFIVDTTKEVTKANDKMTTNPP